MRTRFTFFRPGQARCGTRAQRTVMDNRSPTIAHRVAQPLRTRVGTAITLNARPLRKHSAPGSHLTVQGLYTRFARGRRPLRKTSTPDGRMHIENTVLQDRLAPVLGAIDDYVDAILRAG